MRRIVANHLQVGANRGDFQRQLVRPGHAQVIENPGVLNMLPGINYRWGRTTNRRRDLIINKGRSFVAQSLPSRQRISTG